MRWPRAFERFRVPLALALALLVSASVYRAHARGPLQANAIDRVILAITGPIQRFLVGSVGAVSDAWHRYVDVVDARANEGALRRELALERRRRAALEVLEVENAHLRALLDLEAKNPSHDLQAAEIIGAGLDPGARVLRIDKGALHGLERGHPVLSGQGLVGRVLDVAWTTAELQLIADPRVSVPAKVLRTGARGRLRGRGGTLDFRLVLSEVLRSDDVRPGDRVVTSGLGGIYPPGIPVGIVTRLFTEEGVPHRFADVVPHVDFARLEAVDVLVRPSPSVPLVTPEPLLPPALRARPDGGSMDLGLTEPWPPVRPDAGLVDGRTLDAAPPRRSEGAARRDGGAPEARP